MQSNHGRLLLKISCGALWLTVCLSSSALFAQSTNSPDPFNPPDQSQLSEGRYIYRRNCVFCHGTRGDGRGEMGLTIIPRPRNFTTGIFKYRSTPSGALPTDADLERTVREGIPGTAMPVFGGTLSTREIRAVIQYVKDLSPKWNRHENYAPPLVLPPLPAWFSDAAQLKSKAENGRKLFATACASCHGENAQGNGPAVTPELVDVWGNPARPADLTQPALHSGRELTDAYKALATGINGTPMPSFLEVVTDAQRWELVAFISELRQGKAQNITATVSK